MIVGYTGPRTGMTPNQKTALRARLIELKATEGHHGDCQGGDAEFDAICLDLGIRRVAHPPINPKYRARCKSDEVREPKDYLPRDRDIVDESEHLIGTPTKAEVWKGSGTWYTIHYAQKVKRPHDIYEDIENDNQRIA